MALPANLAIFWLELDGSMPAVLILGAISALIGAFLLIALDGSFFSGRAITRASSRRSATVHEFPRYSNAGPAPRF